MIYIYDVECFKYDWLVTFKNHETGQFTCIWNDNDALMAFLQENDIYVGFNSKHYDLHMIRGIVHGYTAQQLKQVNDFIIGGGIGWECPMLKDVGYFPFNNVDIRDDTQQGLSLKAIEGHLGLSIKESSVPFDIDRPLTAAERAETEFYCKHDVDTTEKLFEIRKDYLKNKINLGRLAGLKPERALSMTNAKLTAAMLKAQAKPHDDERAYTYPENLRREYIPQEVFDFFDRMYDKTVSDDELFNGKLNLMIGDCPVTIGYGGIHGAIPNFFWTESEGRGIWNEDVGSFYPHLMTINGYTSRNIPSPKIYADVLNRRMKAKADGDKATANALKLVCNTTYGCLLNQYNDLYDPLMGRSVCVSGQLYLLELAEHCHREIGSLKIVQLNTDGIMVECDRQDYEKLATICTEWQERTGFELEEDTLSKIAQKDVNNYVEVQSNGTIKAKGGYMVKGIAPAGAFNINNSCVIVATALKEYLVNGTPVEETILKCDDIFQFQIIAKAGAKYKESYHVIDGEKQSVQKVNRVYATADTRYGKLYKVKAENDSTAKIEMLPEHCIIDNENALTIDDIDKTFYIEMAKKRVNDFLGIKPEKISRKRNTKMATTKPNIYKRLAIVREKFLANGIKKTGKNTQLRSMYFQLEDIVPISTPLFHEQNLLPLVNFTDTDCKLTIMDMDDENQSIVFSAPVREWNGNAAVTPVQAMGATITYMRRYLYQIALDIVEVDEMESGATPTAAPTKPTPAPKPTIPVAPEKREAITAQMTAPEGEATSLQVNQLKKKLKDLRAKKGKEEWIASIAVETNGFTEMTKARCEEILTQVAHMMEDEKNVVEG